MIADVDIWSAAALLVKQHREDARIGQRADELFEAGDYEGAALTPSMLSALLKSKPDTPVAASNIEVNLLAAHPMASSTVL